MPRRSPRCKPAVCNFTQTIVVQHAQQTNVFVGNTLTDSQRESVFSGTIALVGVICRQLLSLQRISEVPCSFVGVTFAFLFVESRVFSSFTPCGAAGALHSYAEYSAQRYPCGEQQG